ncbi:MAG: helix-turn-helix domain-containing protein [Acidimicrobiia bacterium]
MITNEVQYRATKAHAARFEAALRNLESRDDSPDRKRRQLEIAAVRAQLGDLEAELAEYEQLRSGTVRSFEAGSLPELAVALVKARIAKGWSQRRLAEELGVAEQQIQRYESTGYTAASLARLCDVVAALGVDVREIVSLPSTDAA